MSVQIRIFLGFLQNKEMKLHLKQSAQWKEALLLSNTALTLVQDHEKDYMGLYLPPLLTCRQIKEKEQEIKSQLQLFCPKLNLDKHHAYLFTQLFVL